MNLQKRVAAIHDISGIGKCSLTVALPILSAADINCAVLPTAVLSTQTSGFEDFTFRDLTDDLIPIAEHWKKENIHFDALYSGFLGSFAQIEILKNIFALFNTEDTIIMVDPVLGDNGELYSMFAHDFVSGMIELCKTADIIVPNRTEAAFLLQKEYIEGPMSENEVNDTLFELAELGARQVVLTGVQLKDNDLGAACYDTLSGQVDYVMSDNIEGIYYGTGDIFASFLLGALMRDKSLQTATRIAVEHTWAAIKITSEGKTDPRLGVRFESVLTSYGNIINN